MHTVVGLQHFEKSTVVGAVVGAVVGDFVAVAGAVAGAVMTFIRTEAHEAGLRECVGAINS